MKVPCTFEFDNSHCVGVMFLSRKAQFPYVLYDNNIDKNDIENVLSMMINYKFCFEFL